MSNNLSWVIWHVTNLCNIECNYCFTNSSPFSEKTLEEKQLMKIAEKIRYSEAKLVTLIGGEPLVVKPLPEITEYLLGENKLKVNLDTNGILLNKKWSDVYLGLNRINISFDDINKQVHNYQREGYPSVIGAISLLQKKSVPFGNTITVTSRNLGNLERTAEFLLENGSSAISFSRMKPIGRGKEQSRLSGLNYEQEKEAIDRILNFKEKSKSYGAKIVADGFYDERLFKEGLIDKLPSCLCGEAKVTISHRGLVYPCESIPFAVPKNLVNRIFDASNLLEKDFEEIMNEGKMVKWRKQTYSRSEECKNCTFQLYCNSGCHFFNSLSSGKISSKDSYCKIEN